MNNWYFTQLRILHWIEKIFIWFNIAQKLCVAGRQNDLYSTFIAAETFLLWRWVRCLSILSVDKVAMIRETRPRLFQVYEWLICRKIFHCWLSSWVKVLPPPPHTHAPQRICVVVGSASLKTARLNQLDVGLVTYYALSAIEAVVIQHRQ